MVMRVMMVNRLLEAKRVIAEGMSMEHGLKEREGGQWIRPTAKGRCSERCFCPTRIALVERQFDIWIKQACGHLFFMELQGYQKSFHLDGRCISIGHL